MKAVRDAFELALWFSVRAAFVVVMIVGAAYGLGFVADAQSSGFFASEGGQLLGYAMGLVSAVFCLLFFVAVFRFFSSARSGFRDGLNGSQDND